MRRLLIAVILMTVLGCQTVTSPFEHRPTMRVDDPSLPTSEQMRRGRDRLPLPDPTPTVAPRTYTESPDMHNR
jgi:hypothetical protein